jgi:hypothetical protein|tara:strand:+ start:128 stop:259 length:132 start_codon:yes stop_codon:yes gene_type:complete
MNESTSVDLDDEPNLSSRVRESSTTIARPFVRRRRRASTRANE